MGGEERRFAMAMKARGEKLATSSPELRLVTDRFDTADPNDAKALLDELG
jgi:hypothetical protein